MELTREIEKEVLKNFYEHYDMCFNDGKVKEYLNHKFPKREGWFYNPDTMWLKFIKDGKMWGWHGKNVWSSSCTAWLGWDRLKPAPEELVIERAKEELVRRGYIDGAKVRTLYEYHITEVVTIEHGEHRNFKKELIQSGFIWLRGVGSNPLVMQNGEWAEIIDDKQDRLTEIQKQLEKLLIEIEKLKK